MTNRMSFDNSNFGNASFDTPQYQESTAYKANVEPHAVIHVVDQGFDFALVKPSPEKGVFAKLKDALVDMMFSTPTHRPIGMSQLSRNEDAQNHATSQEYPTTPHHSIFFQNQPTYQDYRLVKPQFLEETNETLR